MTTSDGVRVLDLRRTIGAVSVEGTGTGAKRHGRWDVRGHFRNQFYPSIGQHKRIWIEQHEAGARDAVASAVETVYIVRGG